MSEAKAAFIKNPIAFADQAEALLKDKNTRALTERIELFSSEAANDEDFPSPVVMLMNLTDAVLEAYSDYVQRLPDRPDGTHAIAKDKTHEPLLDSVHTALGVAIAQLQKEAGWGAVSTLLSSMIFGSFERGVNLTMEYMQHMMREAG